jgi:putative solute:sodium symporter small subunit
MSSPRTDTTGPSPLPPSGPDLHQPAVAASLRRYWRTNVAVMTVLLSIWAVAGLGCGILFADVLNQWRIGGIPLGFWFAQQGSIIVFVVLILVYCIILNRLDAHHHRELESLRNGASPENNL